MFGKLLNRIAPVAEDAFLTVDVGDSRFALCGVGKTPIGGCQAHVGPETADVDGDITFCSDCRWQNQLLVTVLDYCVNHKKTFLGLAELFVVRLGSCDHRLCLIVGYFCVVIEFDFETTPS